MDKSNALEVSYLYPFAISVAIIVIRNGKTLYRDIRENITINNFRENIAINDIIEISHRPTDKSSATSKLKDACWTQSQYNGPRT